MAITSHTFSISADTAKAKLNEKSLELELRRSSIETALHDIGRVGTDDVKIWWKSALSEGDQVTQELVVNNHLGKAGEIEAPTALDGKPYYTPDLFPKGDYAVHTDIGDDTVAGAIADGVVMEATASVEGDTPITFRFLDTIHLAGGSVYRENGKMGDYIKYRIYAPATANEVSNPGAGMFNKVEVIPSSGLNIFVPAAGDGQYDLDLTEKENANVAFTKAVPVPNPTGTGFFDYDVVTHELTANTVQEGSHDLFDFEVTLSRHIPRLGLMGSGYKELTIPAVKPATLLPHWKHEVCIHHAGGGNALEVTWDLIIGRKKTV